MKVASPVSPVLFFPSMNGSLVPAVLPKGVLLMNSGRTDGSAGTWRPENLPYDRRRVQAMLREYLAFGDRFAKPSDMSHFSVRGLDDFYTDSRQAIQSELMGSGARNADPRAEALQRAQMVLALGELLEERVAEMRSLESRVNESRADFARALGIEAGEDEELEIAGAAGVSTDEESVPWERLLEPFLLFLPENGALLFFDSGIKSGLEERGVRFEPLKESDATMIFPDASVPQGCAAARAAAETILSADSAALVGHRDFMLIFWKAGA